MPRPSHNDPAYRAALREMSRRIHKLLDGKQWNQAALTREASKYMPDGARFGPDNTSNFVNGKRRPTRVFLLAMCKAFGVEEEAILPDYFRVRPDGETPALPLFQLAPLVGKPGVYRVIVDLEMPRKDAVRFLEAYDAIGSDP